MTYIIKKETRAFKLYCMKKIVFPQKKLNSTKIKFGTFALHNTSINSNSLHFLYTPLFTSHSPWHNQAFHELFSQLRTFFLVPNILTFIQLLSLQSVQIKELYHPKVSQHLTSLRPTPVDNVKTDTMT